MSWKDTAVIIGAIGGLVGALVLDVYVVKWCLEIIGIPTSVKGAAEFLLVGVLFVGAVKGVLELVGWIIEKVVI